MSDLLAGRELDALIAEKVMELDLSPITVRHTEARIIEMGVKPHIPLYSTDISAAWEVVARMWTNGQWLLRLERYSLDADVREDWGATFEQWLEDGEVIADGETAPLAICLAALKAVGHD